MFNETSYPTCGLGDAAAVQRRLDAGKRVKDSKLAKFGLTAPALPPAHRPIVTLPVGRDTGGGIGPAVDPATGQIIAGGDTPAASSDASTGDSGGGFDLGGIFSALPWWVWAIGAYMLLKRR